MNSDLLAIGDAGSHGSSAAGADPDERRGIQDEEGPERGEGFYESIEETAEGSKEGCHCDRTVKLNGLIKRNGHHLNASGALA